MLNDSEITKSGGIEIPVSSYIDDSGPFPVLVSTGPSYEFYPVWVQPAVGAQFAKVRFDPPESYDGTYFIDFVLEEEIPIFPEALDLSRIIPDPPVEPR